MASISWLDHLPQPPAPPHSSLLCSLHHLCIFSLLKSCHLISLPIGGRLADPYISLSLSHVLFMWILPGGEKKKKGKRKDDCFRTLVVLFIPGSIVLTLLPGNCKYLQLWYVSTLNAMYVTTCKYGENQIVLNVRIGQIMKKRFFYFFPLWVIIHANFQWLIEKKVIKACAYLGFCFTMTVSLHCISLEQRPHLLFFTRLQQQ